MSARGRQAKSLATPQMNRLNEASRGTRLATSLSSHKTGAGGRTGGDGDGGIAEWKTPAGDTNIYRQSLTARLEKPTIASTLRAASNRNKVLSQKVASPRKVVEVGSTSPRPAERLKLQRKAAGGVSTQKKESQAEAQNEVRRRKLSLLEIGVQTNEAEILNRDLIVGDIKLLMPSPELAEKIDRARLDSKKKLDQPTMRKFSPHEQDEEQHLDELKEFMERSYVTRRIPKKPPLLTLSSYDSKHGNVFKSMDEFFTREVPRAESLTNLKDRIKRKEVELMSLFDDVKISEKSDSESESEEFSLTQLDEM